MKFAIVSAVIAISASSCTSSHVERPACQAGRVCVSMEQIGKSLSIQITNNTGDMVVIPEFSGLGSMTGTHLVKIKSGKGDAEGPIRTGGVPISSQSRDVVLRPQGWIGFSVQAEDVRSIYRIPPGCQELSVSYQINTKDGDYYSGEVAGMKARVCL